MVHRAGGPGEMPRRERQADFGGSYSMDEDILRKLEERLGPLRARQRLGIETDHEALTPVCTENLIRVDDVMESHKLAE